MDSESRDHARVPSDAGLKFMFSFKSFKEQIPWMVRSSSRKQNMTPAAVMMFFKAARDNALVELGGRGAYDYKHVWAVEYDAVSYGEWTIFKDLAGCDDDLVCIDYREHQDYTVSESLSRRSWAST